MNLNKILTQTPVNNNFQHNYSNPINTAVYEKSKGEDLGQETSFWFSKLAILHTLLAEDEFSWHHLRLMNYTSQSSRQLSINQSTGLLQVAEGEESKFTRKKAILKTPL